MAGKSASAAGTVKGSSQNLIGKYELEIEKLRDENKWLRLRELVSSIPNKDPKIEIQLKFYLAECDFESYLYSNPSIFTVNQSTNNNESATTTTQQSSLPESSSTSVVVDETKKLLYDIETTFKDFISQTVQTSLEVQAGMLLAKLFYSQSRVEEANKLLNTLKLQKTLNEHIKHLKQQQQLSSSDSKQQQQIIVDLSKLYSLRQLQIYAEAHCLRGLCLEANRRQAMQQQQQQHAHHHHHGGGVGPFHQRPSSVSAGTDSAGEQRQQQAEKNANNSSNSSEMEALTLDSFEVASKFAVEHSLLVNQRLMASSPLSSATQSSPVGGPGSGAGVATGASISGSVNTSVGTLGAGATLGTSSGAVVSAGGTIQAGSPSAIDVPSPGMDDSLMDLINPLYEIALQKAPILYIKRGDLQIGIRKFRELLLKKNIQSITSIRQILLKKFAETLMFHIPPNQYVSILRMVMDDKQKSLYKPTNQDEEILLCLTLSQYLASKEVMLLRHPQFKNIREYTFNNAITSLDMLIVFLAYHRSYNILSDKFEMTMKYSFEQFYVWFQYGLSLICDQKYYKAYMILKECSRMRTDHVTCHLLLARLAVENLFMIDEAIDWCHKVNKLSGNKNKQALIILGCSMTIKAKQQKLHNTQIEYYEKALNYFKKANSLDPNDFIGYFHIARIYAIFRQINESMEWIQRALKYKPDDKDSLHLLALLLTSTKNYEDAHTVISKACALFDDFELLFTKIKIEEVLYGFNYSVNSLLNLILIYKQKLAVPNDNMSTRSSSALSLSQPVLVNTAAKNVAQANGPQNLENWSTFETASLLNLQNEYKINESIGKTVTTLVQSEQIALKYGNTYGQSQNVEQLLILIRLLAQIGEFYLRHDRLNDAEMCCQEMASIHPMSYLYIYLRGRIFEYKEDYSQAKLCYQNALSINPYHIASLQQISLVLCELENYHLAEKMIRDAIALNSSQPESWHILARILDYQKDNHSAIKCYQTCLQLEATNPILPFSSLTRIF